MLMTLNLNKDIQPEFRPALRYLGKQIIAYFGNRLQAIYLGGSIAFGEALVGVSDADWWMFLADEPHECELAWCRDLQHTLTTRFPEIAEYHLTPYSLARLEQEAFWRYAFRHNAIQLYGDDVLSAMEARGIHIDTPNRVFAINRLRWMKPLLESLQHGTVPPYLYPTPETPCHAIRKLARYFVILDGAYLLMAEGKFSSFRAKVVLPSLRATFPAWKSLYDMTALVLNDPSAISFTQEEYLEQLIPFFAAAIEHNEGFIE